MQEELSLKDRLQPALLDRLTDDERSLTIFRIAPDPARLRALGITGDAIERVLTTSGFRRLGPALPGKGGRAVEYLAPRPDSASPRSLRVRGEAGTAESTLAD